MIWRRRKIREKEQAHAQAQAEDAVLESLKDLHSTIRQAPEVKRLADRLRQIQQDNHIGPALHELYRGRLP